MKKSFLLFCLAMASAFASPRLDEAKRVAKDYSRAVAQLDAEAMVAAFHPDLQRFFADTMIPSLSAITKPELLKSLLGSMEVTSLDELRSLPPEQIAARFLKARFSDYDARTRAYAASLKCEILAATEEQETIYVIYLMTSTVPDAPPAAPQVMVFKLLDGVPRLSLTNEIAQLQTWAARQRKKD